MSRIRDLEDAIRHAIKVVDAGAPPIGSYWDGHGFNARGEGGLIPYLMSVLDTSSAHVADRIDAEIGMAIYLEREGKQA